MEFQEIELFIDKNGQVKIEVSGVQGMACLDLTRELEAALGGQVEAREMKTEAYEGSREQLKDKLQQKNK